MPPGDMDSLVPQLCEALMASPAFEGLLQFVSERAVVKYVQLGKVEVPRLIVSAYETHGLALFVTPAGEIKVKRGKGPYRAPEETLKALLALYRADVVRYIRQTMPHRDEVLWKKMQEDNQPLSNGAAVRK